MNQSLVQFDDVERNSASDIIGSGLVQLSDEAERNSAADMIGSANAPANNQELLQMYMSDESERNSPADMIGSGPEYIGYLDISDVKKKITEQDKANMYVTAAITHTPVPEIAKVKVEPKPMQAQTASVSSVMNQAKIEKLMLESDKREIATTKEEIRAVAKKLQVGITPAMMMKDSDDEISSAMVEKAMSMGHTR